MCLGRMGQACPALLKHSLPEVLERWCKFGQLVAPSAEADSDFAYLWGGLLTVLQVGAESYLTEAIPQGGWGIIGL